MHFLEEIKKWIGEITEIALLLIALTVAVAFNCYFNRGKLRSPPGFLREPVFLRRRKPRTHILLNRKVADPVLWHRNMVAA